MSTVRPGGLGATRVCPHCKATVLESASICPGCRHHLRFSSAGAQPETDDSYCALSIDGTIAHQPTPEPCEYCVVIDIRNERGEQVTRQVVGVGALQPGELRRLNVSVDLTPVRPLIKTQPAAAKPAVPAARPGVAAATPAAAGPSPAPGATPASAPTAGADAAARQMPPGSMPVGPAGKLPPLKPPPAVKPQPPSSPGRLRLFRKS